MTLRKKSLFSVARRADDQKHPMNAIIADLINDDIVKRNEQLIFMKLPIKRLWR
jgi:hypothetical protein